MEHIDLDICQVVMLFAVLMAAYAAFVHRKRPAVKLLFITACCFSLYSTVSAVADYRQTFLRPVGRDFVYKSAGRMLHITRAAEPDFFGAYEIRKYMARYGQDTLMIRVE